jgi:exopolysaccharide biosynthesis polyprenyl glycosylphosphotransferase
MSISPNVRTSGRASARPAREGLRRFVRPGSPGGPRAPFVEATAPVAVRTRDRRFRRLLVAADVLAAAVTASLLAWGLGHHDVAIFALVAIAPFVNTAAGLYRRDEMVLSKTTLDEAPALFQAATLSAVAAHMFDSALVATPRGATFVASTLLCLTVFSLLSRFAARGLGRLVTPVERCLVIGEPGAAERLERALTAQIGVNAEIVGRLDLEAAAGDALRHAVARAGVHRVLIAGDEKPPEQVHDAIHVAKAHGVSVSVMPRMFEVVGSSVAFDRLGGLTMLGVRRFGLSPRARLVKRALDIAGAGTLLVVLSPLLALIATLIRATSPGPALFHQTRVGRDGRRFEVLKFRSMVADAEQRKHELAALNEADGLFKIAEDPRITPFGRFLRRRLLDELPQLINVLRGEMSLVGPRPLIVDEDEKIHGRHRGRLHLTPGMTGPWQVAGSARIPLREMVTIDYLYVANWSLWGDLKILARTVPCMIRRRGQ